MLQNSDDGDNGGVDCNGDDGGGDRGEDDGDDHGGWW